MLRVYFIFLLRDYSMLFKQDKEGRDLDEQAQFVALQDI